MSRMMLGLNKIIVEEKKKKIKNYTTFSVRN